MTVLWQWVRPKFFTWICVLGGTISMLSAEARMQLADLTPEQKVGQLLVAGVFDAREPRNTAFDPVYEDIANNRLGGVILFRYNIENPTQAPKLTEELASKAPPALPLLLAVDQEGGIVERLSPEKGFMHTESALKIAETLTSEDAYAIYKKMAEQTKKAGFNWVYGPVVDLHQVGGLAPSPVIGGKERSFGSDPALVAAYARAFIQAHQDVGLLVVLKHFPGHGSAQGDSHHGYTDVTKTWDPIELKPYALLAETMDVPSVMTAHVVHKDYDAEHPATMSSVWMKMLRDMGFQGVIVSDDMHMGAIQQHYTTVDAAIRAINAGVDMLIISNNPAAANHDPHFEPTYENVRALRTALIQAVQDGLISQARLNEAVQRVLDMKARLDPVEETVSGKASGVEALKS